MMQAAERNPSSILPEWSRARERVLSDDNRCKESGLTARMLPIRHPTKLGQSPAQYPGGRYRYGNSYPAEHEELQAGVPIDTERNTARKERHQKAHHRQMQSSSATESQVGRSWVIGVGRRLSQSDTELTASADRVDHHPEQQTAHHAVQERVPSKDRWPVADVTEDPALNCIITSAVTDRLFGHPAECVEQQYTRRDAEETGIA